MEQYHVCPTKLINTVMILHHYCAECENTGETELEDDSIRQVKCSFCGTINDFWLEGELPSIRHLEFLHASNIQ